MAASTVIMVFWCWESESLWRPALLPWCFDIGNRNRCGGQHCYHGVLVQGIGIAMAASTVIMVFCCSKSESLWRPALLPWCFVAVNRNRCGGQHCRHGGVGNRNRCGGQHSYHGILVRGMGIVVAASTVIMVFCSSKSDSLWRPVHGVLLQ